jgi:hypothetical protein
MNKFSSNIYSGALRSDEEIAHVLRRVTFIGICRLLFPSESFYLALEVEIESRKTEKS